MDILKKVDEFKKKGIINPVIYNYINKIRIVRKD
jgi:hypothetical protein